MGMLAPSLHRESTDSLIHQNWSVATCIGVIPFCRSIYPIQSRFRVVGVGEPPKSSGSSPQASWINPDLLTMFQFHSTLPLPVDEEREVLHTKVRRYHCVCVSAYICISLIYGAE